MWPRLIRQQAFHHLVAMSIAALAGLSLAHRRANPLESLVSAASRSNLRPIEARLADFPYARTSVTRSGDYSTTALLRLHGVAGEILDNSAIHDLHLTGVCQLIGGNPSLATASLEHVAQSSIDPRVWNDLAAARMELAKRHDIPELFAESLAASIRAIELDPEYLPAYFNRALALDALHLNPAAERAYADYLNRDASSPWANETRQRLASLPKTTTASEWSRERAKLERACRSGDDDSVVTIVRRFAQEARTWGEGPYLSNWADTVDHDPAVSADSLLIARCIGRALQTVSGERLLLDVVVAIEGRDRQATAQAYALYRNGRLAYRDGKLRAAAGLFEQSATILEKAGSPMGQVAKFYRAATTVDSGDSRGGLTLLDALETEINPAWLALHAQIETERALALGRTDRIYETIDAARDALHRFEALRENENTLRSRTNLLAALTMTGASAEAWRMRQKLFADASASGAPNVLPAVLLNAVNDEVFESKWEIAGALAGELAKLDIQSQVVRAEALLWRDFARARGTTSVDRSIFGSAHAAAGAIPDPDLRDEFLDKLHLAEADLLAERDPERARRFAEAAIAYRQARFPYILPHAFVVRARAFRTLGDSKSAANDLDRAMDAVENQRRTFRDDVSRDGYVGGDDRMFDEALDLAASSADYSRMFSIAEHSNARLITDRLSADTILRSPGDACHHVPPDTAILHLTTLPTYSIGIVIRTAGTRVVKIATDRRTLLAQVEGFLAAITHDDRGAANDLARELYDELFVPFSREINSSSSLVVITDATLASIPFSALLDRATDRYVLEDHAVTRAPSVSTWIDHHAENRLRNRKRVIVAGDPAFDAERFPSLSPLIAARSEVTTIAHAYSDSETIVGKDVTRTRLIASMPEADVIHIAAHAVVNIRDTSLSVMLLTPAEHDAGLFSIYDVMQLRLHRAPVVVLAGCQTAVEGAGRGSTTSFVLAFLAAGSRSAVGTLWNVDDEVAHDFSIAFHRDVSSGVISSAAARRAQIAVMRERGRDHLRAWAGFQLYGYD